MRRRRRKRARRERRRLRGRWRRISLFRWFLFSYLCLIVTGLLFSASLMSAVCLLSLIQMRQYNFLFKETSFVVTVPTP